MMTHHDAGHYRKKHPPETPLDPRITKALKAHESDGAVTCAAAHAIAAELGRSPAQVGVAMDLLELRITKCQLGLFGYSPQRKVVKPAAAIEPPVEAAIRAAVVSGKMGCARAWAIAEENGIKKMAVASAAEKLGFKISPCQLGAF